jgi:hypothetical protein
VLLEMLDAGDLTLTSVSLLAPHLDDANHRDVLGRATHRSKREVEEIVAALRPKADVPTSIRKVPVPTGSAPVGVPQPARSVRVRESPAFSVACVESREDVVVSNQAALSWPAPTAASRPAASVHPLSPERYKLQLTISGSTRGKLRRAQDLLRHSVPAGDIATVLDRALDLLLADLERIKFAETSRPHRVAQMRTGSRHIPAAVRRAVWRRDGGACSFRREGRRCGETAFLEFHHVRPYADGGEATVDNIELRCRAHNQYEAELFFGEPFSVREGSSPYHRLGLDRVGCGVGCTGAVQRPIAELSTW